MATANTTITTDDGWVLVAEGVKCTVQVVQAGAYAQPRAALYQRATSAPAGASMDGIERFEGESVTNSFDDPQNSYVRAVEHDVTVCVITE